MTLDDLLPDARPHLPGVPDVVIKDHLRQSLTRFCRETKFWVEELSAVYPVAGVVRYQLELPDEADIFSVKSATQDGLPIVADVNVFGLMTVDSNIGLTPVRVIAILQPRKTANKVPDRVMDNYRDGIISGAIETLITMPDMEWSNPGAVAYHSSKYAEHKAEAKLKLALGPSGPTRRVRPFTTI